MYGTIWLSEMDIPKQFEGDSYIVKPISADSVLIAFTGINI